MLLPDMLATRLGVFTAQFPHQLHAFHRYPIIRLVASSLPLEPRLVYLVQTEEWGRDACNLSSEGLSAR